MGALIGKKQSNVAYSTKLTIKIRMRVFQPEALSISPTSPHILDIHLISLLVLPKRNVYRLHVAVAITI